jgi:hypothetical protein
MRRLLTYTASIALLCCVPVGAQQASGPGQVVRPRKAEAPEGVKVVGCVLPETRPNAFRLVLAPEAKDGAGPKLPKGLKAGSWLELVARGETNLQPLANQKIEVTGKLTNGNRRLEVVDARPIGACEPVPPGERF